MKIVLWVFSVTVTLVWSACNSYSDNPLEFKELTCNYQQNPVGIDENPNFTWVIDSKESNAFQSGYHILVASNPDWLTPNNADVWNTGKVESDQSVLIRYAGEKLQSSQVYYWKVKVWNQDGNATDWSETQTFETALLDPAIWDKAGWIGLDLDSRLSEYRFQAFQTEKMNEPKMVSSFPVAYFRKEVSLKKEVIRARAYVCGLGYHELFVNGDKIGDHVLDPAPTSYDHHAFYVVHDIPKATLKNENTFGLIVGNGFWGQSIAFTGQLNYGKPTCKMVVKVFYDDGSMEEIYSDENWKVSTGPIVFDNVYAGETYDARYELSGWNKNGYNDSQWESPSIERHMVGELRAQNLPPIRKIKELVPVHIFKGKNGNWILDFGQNISGWVKIRVNEKAGQEIKITTAEALTRKGDELHTGSIGKFATGVDQIDRYICKGGGWEEWEPRFTYHGFQFAEIAGLSEKPEVSNIRVVLVHTDVKKTGMFNSSDSLLNKMYAVSEWTVVDNLHGLPEDCPHREKCGWLGDAHAVAAFCLYNYDMGLFYKKYMEDIFSQLRNANGQQGNQTFLVPTMVAPGKRTAGLAALDWGIAMVYLPWYTYLYNGDRSLIETYYSEIRNLIAYYQSFQNEEGIIQNGLGDWCPPLWDRQDNPEAMECHPYISANAFFYDILNVAKQMALLMDDKRAQANYEKDRINLKRDFNRAFLKYDQGDKRAWYGSQTATVMALQFGMVPDSILSNVVDGLKYDILITHKGHHSTGIHGNRYIYSLLKDLGEPQLSYSILTNPSFPSQAYIIQSGLTTWPERQWEWDSGIEWDRSLNHPMHSGFAAYFFESLGGIRPMAEFPGFKEFSINPALFDQLNNSSASMQCPYGEISVSWERQESSIEMVVKIPFNTKAHLILENYQYLNLDIHNIHADTQSGNSVMSGSVGDKILLGSGEYRILIN
jgi:alpha-L-rhamnosidase